MRRSRRSSATLTLVLLQSTLAYVPWNKGDDYFGSVNWIETSEVRNLIFVCTDPEINDDGTPAQI